MWVYRLRMHALPLPQWHQSAVYCPLEATQLGCKEWETAQSVNATWETSQLTLIKLEIRTSLWGRGKREWSSVNSLELIVKWEQQSWFGKCSACIWWLRSCITNWSHENGRAILCITEHFFRIIRTVICRALDTNPGNGHVIVWNKSILCFFNKEATMQSPIMQQYIKNLWLTIWLISTDQ
jgi:hypothetical protein